MTDLGSMRFRAFALLAAMFVVGAFAGAGLVRFVDRPHPMPPRPPGMELFSRLGLSPEQEVRARAIFEKHRPELDAIVRETMPRVRVVQETVDREMAEILTPEQARRFEELKRNMPPPGAGGPGGLGGPDGPGRGPGEGPGPMRPGQLPFPRPPLPPPGDPGMPPPPEGPR